MPATHLLGMVCSGHGCFPTRPNAQASPDVYIGDIAWHRQGDLWQVHCCGPACHASVLAAGSSTVYVNNKQSARIGDPVACGSVTIEGHTTVFAGG